MPVGLRQHPHIGVAQEICDLFERDAGVHEQLGRRVAEFVGADRLDTTTAAYG